MSAQSQIVGPEERAVARQWVCKHVSTATKSRDLRKRYTLNNTGTVGSSVFYAVHAKAIYWRPILTVSQ
jgi:hypothetical protein